MRSAAVPRHDRDAQNMNAHAAGLVQTDGPDIAKAQKSFLTNNWFPNCNPSCLRFALTIMLIDKIGAASHSRSEIAQGRASGEACKKLKEFCYNKLYEHGQWCEASWLTRVHLQQSHLQ